MEFHIENTQVYGLDKAIIASGNSYRTEMKNNDEKADDKDLKRAFMLGNTGAGEGHDQFLAGIVVEFDLYAPLYMWKQLQRYKFLDFVSSQSTMHTLTKFDIEDQCVEETDRLILNRYHDLIVNYFAAKDSLIYTKEQLDRYWRCLVASLPCGFVLGATMVTNYRSLKTMYLQRKNHKLKEWHKFCEWCESLPYFKELILNKNDN